MAIPQNFRTALAGFHKEDVVQYLEYLNSRHQSELSTLRSQNAELRSMIPAPKQLEHWEEAERLLTEARGELGSLGAQLEQVKAQLASTQSERDDLMRQLSECEDARQQMGDALERQLSAAFETEQTLRQEIVQLKAQLRQSEEAVRQKASSEDTSAKRRSDPSDLFARQQTALIYYQATGVLNHATQEVDGASEALAAATDAALSQLEKLQEAIRSSRAILEDAACIMQAIAPK